MSDIWNFLSSGKGGHVTVVVGNVLEEIIATSKHRLVVTPMHEKVINAIIEFCRNKKLRPLILVTDSVGTNSWHRVIRKRMLPGIEEDKIFGEPNENGFPLFPVIPYNYFGSCFKISSKQQVESRRLHLREISSISAYEGDELSSGDIDASMEMDKVLENLERVNFEEYITGLSPLMEGDVEVLTDELSEVMEILKDQNFDLVIADGAARLGGAWMTLLKEMDSKLPCPFIGFSTFKPEEAFGTKLGHQQRQNFFGTRFTELSLTSLSVDSACRPWRELVSFVEPDRQSAKAIEEVIDNLLDLIQDINYGHRTQLTLNQYVKSELALLAKDMLGNWGRRQDWTSSVLYYSREHDLIDGADWEVYLKKVPEEEFQRNLLVYREYIFNVLLESKDEHDHKYAEQFINRVKKVGYLLDKHEIRPYSSLSGNLLGRTTTKEDRLLYLMEKEWEATGDKFRGLVVADFTDSSQGALDAGLPNSDSCGLMSIFWKCQENLVTVQMNPIVVWENMLYCNPRFASRMEKKIGQLMDEYGQGLRMIRQDDGVYCYFRIQGESFTQAFWTWLVNSLLEDGTTLCILANREVLLDEWNGLGVNTIFNLTVTNSAILRARLAHRLGDTQYMGLPTAHLWDIISVMPEVQGGLSPYFIYRDLRKNNWAICDDGKFELGLGALSPDLGTDSHKTIEIFGKVNAQQELLIPKRGEAALAWSKMGEGEEHSIVLEVFYENDRHISNDISREILVKKNEYKHVKSDFTEVMKSMYEALARSLCEMRDQKYSHDSLSFEIMQRNKLAHRLLVKGSLAGEFIEMVEQLFAPFRMQYYLMTMNLKYGFREKSMFRKATDGTVYESAYAIPDLFKTKDDLKIINKHWQECVGKTKVYSLRIPQTKAVIKKVEESEFNLRPQCFRTELRLLSSTN